MKKLLSVVFLASVLAACSNTPVPEDTGAPVESRAGSGTDVKTVVAGDLDASGLPRELTDPKSQLAQRSIYFDLDRYVVKSDYQGLVAAHAKFLTANPGWHFERYKDIHWGATSFVVESLDARRSGGLA